MFWKVVTLLGLALCARGGPPATSQQMVKKEYVHHGELNHIGAHVPEHHEEYAWAYPSYEFSYSVNDPHTHDIKGQHEHRHGDEVRGEYWLVQPDGRKRTVKYHSDKHKGFNADVHYSEHHEHNHHEEPQIVEIIKPVIEIVREEPQSPIEEIKPIRVEETPEVVVEERPDEQIEPRHLKPINQGPIHIEYYVNHKYPEQNEHHKSENAEGEAERREDQAGEEESVGESGQEARIQEDEVPRVEIKHRKPVNIEYYSNVHHPIHNEHHGHEIPTKYIVNEHRNHEKQHGREQDRREEQRIREERPRHEDQHAREEIVREEPRIREERLRHEEQRAREEIVREEPRIRGERRRHEEQRAREEKIREEQRIRKEHRRHEEQRAREEIVREEPRIREERRRHEEQRAREEKIREEQRIHKEHRRHEEQRAREEKIREEQRIREERRHHEEQRTREEKIRKEQRIREEERERDEPHVDDHHEYDVHNLPLPPVFRPLNVEHNLHIDHNKHRETELRKPIYVEEIKVERRHDPHVQLHRLHNPVMFRPERTHPDYHRDYRRQRKTQ